MFDYAIGMAAVLIPCTLWVVYLYYYQTGDGP